MVSIKSAVFQAPEVEKTATFEMSKDSTKWTDEILNQFFEQLPTIPRDFGADVVINNVDENTGYAKGSVVVWYNDKRINFPIIIKDFKLSPFDVFVKNSDNGDPEYYPATDRNIKKCLTSDQIGKLQNRYDGIVAQDLKTPGAITPKVSIPLYDMPEGMLEPPYSKMSGWRFHARADELKKLAVQLEAQPGVMQSFVDNTGDLISNIVNLKDAEKIVVPDKQKDGILDLGDVVKAKRAVTLIDAQLFDVNKLTPIMPPQVCELRKYSYPSMEDFLESGENASQRFLASKNGKPVVGVVLDIKDAPSGNAGCPTIACGTSVVEKDENGKPIIRNSRPQIFISLCGCYYSKFDDWQRVGVGFYGSKVISAPGALEKAVSMIADNRVADMFTSTNKSNRDDKSDKLFNPIRESEQGVGRNYWCGMDAQCDNSDVFIIYGAGDSWECTKVYGGFRKIMVNNSPVYQSEDCVLIPAKVASVQKVESVESQLYKMVVGKANNIYLIPEGAAVLNSKFMTHINPDELMSPDKSVKAEYEKANITKVAICVESANGYRISGTPVEPLLKLAGLSHGHVFSTSHALAVLQTLGMEKAAAAEAMRVAVDRFINGANNSSVTVYGVNGDYINYEAMEKTAKPARVRELMAGVAKGLKRDFVKTASLLSDPESVDVMLSLNFVNEDNLMSYVDSIGQMKTVISKMAAMLIAARMGLADLNEDALKKAIAGLQDVVDGLENVKIALGK